MRWVDETVQSPKVGVGGSPGARPGQEEEVLNRWTASQSEEASAQLAKRERKKQQLSPNGYKERYGATKYFATTSLLLYLVVTWLLLRD